MRWAIAVAAVACSSAPQGTTQTTQTPQGPVSHKPGVADGTRCTGDSDCSEGQTCFGPDFVSGGGARPQCEVDHDCSPEVKGPGTPRGQICDGRTCGPRCTPSSCPTTERCAANGHCEPRPCTDPHAEKCSAFETCDASSGTCARIACKDDNACPGGACWRGWCYDRGGVCQPSSYCCPP